MVYKKKQFGYMFVLFRAKLFVFYRLLIVLDLINVIEYAASV
jgi:hypothetical protein